MYRGWFERAISQRTTIPEGISLSQNMPIPPLAMFAACAIRIRSGRLDVSRVGSKVRRNSANQGNRGEPLFSLVREIFRGLKVKTCSRRSASESIVHMG